jgi:hypothetical protein
VDDQLAVLAFAMPRGASGPVWSVMAPTLTASVAVIMQGHSIVGHNRECLSPT